MNNLEHTLLFCLMSSSYSDLNDWVNDNIKVWSVVPGTRPLCAHKLSSSFLRSFIRVGRSVSANPCTDLSKANFVNYIFHLAKHA